MPVAVRAILVGACQVGVGSGLVPLRRLAERRHT